MDSIIREMSASPNSAHLAATEKRVQCQCRLPIKRILEKDALEQQP